MRFAEPMLRNTARALRRQWWRLRQAVDRAPFDEHFYLAAYSDVAAAVEEGRVSTAYQHFHESGASEGRLAFGSLEPDLEEMLLMAPTTAMVYLELTSRCNLRCVYCPVSQPGYVGADLVLANFDRFVEVMHARRVQIVVMNGHGESSIVKDWDAIADRLADEGFRLHITTNLAKRLTASEVSALSRFDMILVSVDTVDASLLAELRRGANLDTILRNLEAVIGHAARRHRDPEIAVSCVVSDRSALGIAALVDTLLAVGVRKFRFGDLVEYPAVDGAMTVRHVSTLSADELADARAQFRHALDAIGARGAIVNVDPPVAAILERIGETRLEVDVRTPDTATKIVRFDRPLALETRDCLDPWRIAFVHASGEVRPCCFYEETLGQLDAEPLPDIVNGARFRELRRGLLSGELSRSCASCNARSLIGIDLLRAKVEEYVEYEANRTADAPR
ncbi:MAG: radical SAM protein [Acidobacteria bacterium]|nr:radical SAM protein [Acidobacteriota bacterium]